MNLDVLLFWCIWCFCFDFFVLWWFNVCVFGWFGGFARICAIVVCWICLGLFVFDGWVCVYCFSCCLFSFWCVYLLLRFVLYCNCDSWCLFGLFVDWRLVVGLGASLLLCLLWLLLVWIVWLRVFGYFICRFELGLCWLRWLLDTVWVFWGWWVGIRVCFCDLLFVDLVVFWLFANCWVLFSGDGWLCLIRLWIWLSVYFWLWLFV